MPASVIGRLGRWCFRHWAWVLGLWVLAVAGGVLATGPLFARLSDGGVPATVESVAAYDVLRTGNSSAGTVVAVIDGVDPTDPALAAPLARVAERLRSVAGVADVELPGPRTVSADGHAVLVSVSHHLDRSARDTAATAIVNQLHGLTPELPPAPPSRSAARRC